MKIVDINKAYQKEDMSTLKTLSKDLQNLISKNQLHDSEINFIKVYYKEICSIERKMFEEKLTCEVIDNDYTSTIPWQLGTIKAYCNILLKSN